MRNNHVKTKVARGEPAFGVWLEDPSPNRIEFFGHLGFDFVIIDSEHRAIGPQRCLELVRACDVANVVAIVRPGDHQSSTILSFLETGALGVYVPHVDTAAQAREIVDAVKYAPEGRRGAGSGSRASNYAVTQSASDYYKQANNETMVILLVEDIVGIQNLDEILKVDGVDAVCIGPGDLSHSMGHTGEKDHPDVMRTVREAESKIAASGLAFDCEPESAADALDGIARGARLIPFFEKPMIASLFREALRAAVGSPPGR
jgi:2-keto-3-deoxy-L-rhamnonate aldolase RhmA